jgi:ABC-type transport system involved in multi-copper enzyme maturation permease subunit
MRKSQQQLIKETKSNRKIMYLIMFFIFLFVLITSNLVFKSLYGVYKSSNWVIVEATLLSATIDQHYSQDGNTTSLTYTPKIAYQYEIDGSFYSGRKVSWTEEYNDSDMLDKARYFVSQFKAGKPIYIYVDPDNPAEAVAYKDINWSRFTGVFISCLIAWFFFIGGIYILVTKLKYP